jgi:hypothetical protein
VLRTATALADERCVSELTIAGRVGLFLRVDDFQASYDRMREAGVEFVTESRDEPYGRVVVFGVVGDRVGPPGGWGFAQKLLSVRTLTTGSGRPAALYERGRASLSRRWIGSP